jgi:hypothetical protein
MLKDDLATGEGAKRKAYNSINHQFLTVVYPDLEILNNASYLVAVQAGIVRSFQPVRLF